jgi:hypothetical protein
MSEKSTAVEHHSHGAGSRSAAPILVLMSAQAQLSPNIAHLLKATGDYVRSVIQAFDDGVDALDVEWNGDTPNKID